MIRDRCRVLVHPFFFLAENWNGIDEHVLLLSKYLNRDRFELLLLAHESDGPQTQRLAERARMRLVDAPYPAGASAPTRLVALRRLYAAERVDLVHLHSPVAGGQAAPALAARLAGVSATLATYHQIQPRVLPAKSRAINFLVHALLVDNTLAVSRDVAESLATVAGLPRRRVRIVLNGIDPLEDTAHSDVLPARLPGDVRIGYFGRLSPEKGLPGLLEGLARLAPRCPQAQTLIVGDGPDRGELEAKARALGIADRVRFLGFRPEARALMGEVDIVVHVPVYEGFGLVVLEAMAAGRPVIVNDAPGAISEIVLDGQTGLIVPSGSASALAEALASLAANPRERARLGQNGRARWEQHFSARTMAAQVEALYEHALGRRANDRTKVIGAPTFLGG